MITGAGAHIITAGGGGITTTDGYGHRVTGGDIAGFHGIEEAVIGAGTRSRRGYIIKAEYRFYLSLKILRKTDGFL